ncbi:MAG TPA: CARDB domain-containing protein [Vicinamibacterales bacterium]
MSASPGTRLTGWKQIGGYVGCSVRTAQRWEALYGLPVRRLTGTRGGTVIAFGDELDAWVASERGQAARTDAASELPERDAGSASRAAPSTGAGPTAMPLPRRPRIRTAALAVAGTAAAALIAIGVAGDASMLDTALECPAPCRLRQGESIVLRMTAAEPGDQYTRWTRHERGGVHAFGPPLAPDPSGLVTWGFTTDCSTPPGLHELRLVSVRSGLATRSVHLAVEPTAACSEPVADLVAEGVELDRIAAQPGERLTVRFRIRNQGRAHAPASVARLRLGRSADRTAVTDAGIGDVVTPELGVGAAAALSSEIRIPGDLPPGGGYFVWVVADNGSAVLERVASNNFARSPALTIHPPPAGPR